MAHDQGYFSQHRRPVAPRDVARDINAARIARLCGWRVSAYHVRFETWPSGVVLAIAPGYRPQFVSAQELTPKENHV